MPTRPWWEKTKQNEDRRRKALAAMQEYLGPFRESSPEYARQWAEEAGHRVVQEVISRLEIGGRNRGLG